MEQSSETGLKKMIMGGFQHIPGVLKDECSQK
jgi:hypothetical protein